MFQKILIANRGEIACRVIKTARRLGVQTVAIYSEADRDALHVQMADEAYLIGPAPSSQSYLQMRRIIEVCKKSGAEAVHPGYGFLSENAEFAALLASEEIVFIGPPIEAIQAIGDKIASKQLAQRAKVNIVPGFVDIIRDGDHAVAVAQKVGYPVMLKASAGGGGKGMRVAYDDAECREGFARATSEAQSSFGDTRVFVEKYIEEPRHIEIQILADGETCLYLAERECSIQRRHQKVLEEAPSPFLDESTRRRMGEQAVALAKAVNYQSAGTVEFIVDKHRNFYFLEMNTRLQVEHPVTEMITGLDLVEWMLRVAAGESLPFAQHDIKLTGWAMEARVYAEDPFRNFLPSIGRLVRYQTPPEVNGVRVDTGVYEGAEVSMFYDPMIAKLVAYGEDRAQAAAKLADALDEFYIQGLTHNIPFLAALTVHPRFLEGRLSTNFIKDEYPDGFDYPSLSSLPGAQLAWFVAVFASLHRRYTDRAASIDGQMSGHERRISPDWVVFLGGEAHKVKVEPIDGGHDVIYRGDVYQVLSDWQFGENRVKVMINGVEANFQLEKRGLAYQLYRRGIRLEALVLSPMAAELQRLMPIKQKADLSKFLLSPMPGLLVKLLVDVGEEVKAGQDLAMIEAMKMENVLRAPFDAKIGAVRAKVGDSLAVDQIILEFTE